MNLRNRLGLAVTTIAIAVVGTLSLAACGQPLTGTSTMSPEASALTALGFTNSDVTTGGDATTVQATTGPSANPNGRRPLRLRRLAIRRLALRGHVEHGEVTVSTKDGDKTIDIQRGTVTAITGTTVTVKSTDGFTLTWTFGSPIQVIEHRTTVQPSAVAVGQVVGIAGTRDGGVVTARLMVIPNAK